MDTRPFSGSISLTVPSAGETMPLPILRGGSLKTAAKKTVKQMNAADSGTKNGNEAADAIALMPTNLRPPLAISYQHLERTVSVPAISSQKQLRVYDRGALLPHENRVKVHLVDSVHLLLAESRHLQENVDDRVAVYLDPPEPLQYRRRFDLLKHLLCIFFLDWHDPECDVLVDLCVYPAKAEHYRQPECGIIDQPDDDLDPSVLVGFDQDLVVGELVLHLPELLFQLVLRHVEDAPSHIGLMQDGGRAHLEHN